MSTNLTTTNDARGELIQVLQSSLYPGKRDDGTDGGEAMTEFGDKTDLPGVVVRPRVQLTVRA